LASYGPNPVGRILMFERLETGKILWVDGRSLFDHPAQFDACGHGIDNGNYALEGLRAYDGQLFKPEAHIARLLASARILRLSCPYSAEQIIGACNEVVAMPGMRNAYLRPVIWRSASSIDPNSMDATVHLAIIGWSWPASCSTEQAPTPARLSLAPWHMLMPQNLRGDIKYTHLLERYTMPRLEARESGLDDALMQDHRGIITQTTSANIFFVCAGTLHTPKVENFINGITRQTIIDIARWENIAVYERHILPSAIGYASEVFITGTATGVAPVEAIGDCKFHPGEITALMLDRYRRLVRTRSPAQLRNEPRKLPVKQKAWS